MVADCLLETIDVVSFFNAAVNMAGVNLPEEIKMNMLQNMVMLYLRVRAFSLAKNITSKKKSSNTSSKALRQDIKAIFLVVLFLSVFSVYYGTILLAFRLSQFMNM